MSTILLVEDEKNQQELYRMELEDEGYRVAVASSGREALKQVTTTRPDLVVLDLHMPGMDGVDTLERMMGLNTRLPIIIYSAYEKFKDNFMTWAADAYLVKSSDLGVLKNEIKRVLSSLEAEGRQVWAQEREASHF